MKYLTVFHKKNIIVPQTINIKITFDIFLGSLFISDVTWTSYYIWKNIAYYVQYKQYLT